MGTINLKETAAGKTGSKLRESYNKSWDKMQDRVLESLRGQIRHAYGEDMDIKDEEIKSMLDFTDPNFSIKGFRESAYRFFGKIREANAEGGLSQLLRAGIQMSVNSEYQSVETNFEEIVNSVPSNKAIELYAPLYRAGFMADTEEGDEPVRLGAKGADFQIRNGKKAAIFEVTEEMLEDDMTSQITEQAQQIGQNGKILKDSIVFVRWLGKAGVDAGGRKVAASQTGAQAGETTWPFNVKFANGGGQNRLTTYTAFAYNALLEARQLARQMKDPKGNKMLVNPSALIGGSALQDIFEELLTSDYYASTSNMKIPSGAKADTGIGTGFARNIMKGKYNPVTSIWLPDTAWGIMQAGKGLTLQNRRPLRVLSENPASGPAFTCSVFRYKIDERWAIDWREPRFAILGSDGTI
jgi:hypothetical protein